MTDDEPTREDAPDVAADPRYDVTEDGKLVPHTPDDQDFDLEFTND